MALYHFRTALMLMAIGLAVLLFMRIRSPRPKVFVFIGLVAAIALPVEMLGYWTTLHHFNNAPLYNIFTWLEFLLLVAMVHGQRPLWRNTLVCIALLGTVVMVVSWFRVGTLNILFIEGIVVMALLLALIVGALLWSVANSSVVPLHRLPQFWSFMGLLLYFGALPPVVTLARTVTDRTMATTLWTIMPVLCALRYLLIAYAFWMAERRPGTDHG